MPDQYEPEPQNFGEPIGRYGDGVWLGYVILFILALPVMAGIGALAWWGL